MHFMYLCVLFPHSDSEELVSTLSDNAKLITIPVKYEAGLTFKVWVAKETNEGTVPTLDSAIEHFLIYQSRKSRCITK